MITITMPNGLKLSSSGMFVMPKTIDRWTKLRVQTENLEFRPDLLEVTNVNGRKNIVT